MRSFCKRAVSMLLCGKSSRFQCSTLFRVFRAPLYPLQVSGTTFLTMAGALFLQASLVGCGMAASPQPPSLQLPRQIPNLTAGRNGDQVNLHWTTPKENTDRLKLQKMVRLRICRRQQQTASWETVATITAAPGQPAQYTDALPAPLTAGTLRPLRYSIFGINKHGRTAGPSNIAMVLAGPAPPQVQDLSLQVIERGVLLHWQPVPNLPSGTSVEIDRTLAAPVGATPAGGRSSGIAVPTAKTTSAKPEKSGSHNLLRSPAEPVQQMLRVNLSPAASPTTGQAETAEENDPGIALDTSTLFGRKYRYSVRRIIERKIDNQTLAVAGTPSAPIQIETRDIFPPSVPVGLAAIPVSASMNHGAPEVDLSWSVSNEPDLAQYRIYRRDVTLNTPMQRIIPTESIVAPAFRDLHVQAGHTYAYAISAVDVAGNESPHSQSIEVTVPTS